MVSLPAVHVVVIRRGVEQKSAFLETHPESVSFVLNSENEGAARVQEKFHVDLKLPHVGKDSILNCVCDADSLDNLAAALYLQTERANKVFEMLDTGGKGVVVIEDLQRAATEFLDDGSVDDDDLVDMMQEFDKSSSDGEGLLTKDDIVLIARKVGL